MDQDQMDQSSKKSSAVRYSSVLKSEPAGHLIATAKKGTRKLAVQLRSVLDKILEVMDLVVSLIFYNADFAIRLTIKIVMPFIKETTTYFLN